MSKQVNTGVKLSVSAGQPATFDEAGYGAMTFTEVGEVLTVGEFGGQSDEVQSQPLATGVTEFFKGFIQYGNPSLGLERDATDAGQLILKGHFDGAEKNDALSGEVVLPDGEIIYLDVRVFSYNVNVGGANSMIGSTANLRVNKVPVYVDAP